MYLTHHSFFIYNLLKQIKPNSYLELGIYEGETFNLINKICNHCVGVDLTNKRLQNIGIFYEMSTDCFFENNKETFDVIFIDANHDYHQVKKDFINCESILNEYGLILLHDTDPQEQKYLDKGYCSDSYKIINYLEKTNNYEYITFPISESGLTIVKRKKDKRINNFIKQTN
jgi:hypothetical protein